MMKPTAGLTFLIFAACLSLTLAAAPEQSATHSAPLSPQGARPSPNNQTDRDRAFRGTGLQPVRQGCRLPSERFGVEIPTAIAAAFLCRREEVAPHGPAWSSHAEPAHGLLSVIVHGLESRVTERHETLIAT
jgi:hypothetical protein